MIELIVKTIFFSILIYLFLDGFQDRTFLMFKRKNNEPNKMMNVFFRKFFNLNRIEAKIKEAGNPFNMNSTGFVFLKILLPFIGFLSHLSADTSILYSVGTIILCFFLPDIFLLMVIWDRKKEIIEELPDIVDIFEVATVAGIDTGHSFQIAANFSKGKEIKKELVQLAAEYALTKDKEMALDNFKKKINIFETDLLVGALKQQNITGKSKNLLEALSLIHSNNRIAGYQRRAKSIQYKVLFACALMAFSISIIYLYPYFSGLEKGLINIF